MEAQSTRDSTKPDCCAACVSQQLRSSLASSFSTIIILFRRPSPFHHHHPSHSASASTGFIRRKRLDKFRASLNTKADAAKVDMTTEQSNQADAIHLKGALAFPKEIWLSIIGFLVQNIEPYASTCPHPDPMERRLEDLSEPWPRFQASNLLALASTCKQLHLLILQLVYHLWHSSSLVYEGDHDRPPGHKRHGDDWPFAEWIRAIHVSMLWYKRVNYPPSGTIFQFAPNLDQVSLEDTPRYEFLSEFLAPQTSCRPRRVTIRFHGPTLEALTDPRFRSSIRTKSPLSEPSSLAPLSQLTHLHLVNLVPPPSFISFLIGFPLSRKCPPSVLEAIRNGLSPCNTLECLRLSYLPSESLMDFDEYISYRNAWKTYAQLPRHERKAQVAPMPPELDKDRLSAQEALYDLAVNTDSLPRLRLLILDAGPCKPLGPPTPLPRPGEYRRRFDPSSDHYFAIDRPEDKRTWTPDAKSFSGHAKVTATAGAVDEDHRYDPHCSDRFEIRAEHSRIRKRDHDWRRIQAGKRAFICLWNRSRHCKESPSIAGGMGSEGVSGLLPTEIRVAVPWPRAMDFTSSDDWLGWHYIDHFNEEKLRRERHNIITDLNCQAPRPIPSEENRPLNVGVWADPDVFGLVESDPHLSYRFWRELKTYYWTGELPRESDREPTDGMSTAKRLSIPSLIPRIGMKFTAPRPEAR